MGKGRDKRKKAKGHVSGQGASKTARKTSLNDAKKDRRSQRMGEGDDEDIDVLLARFELQDKAAKAVTVHEDCGAPSARVNCTILHTNNPKLDEVVMFGGEYWDKATDKVHTYNDLYRYDCGRNKWKHITSATSPSPRCAHAASVLGSCLYVVGGEFQTPNQDRFRHFKDVWRLDLASNTWDQLPCKGGPSPRSGARMLTWKGRLLLFGGYYDADTKLKYYNDAWEYDVEAFKWRELGDAGSALRPSPRSGCGLVLDGDVLYVIGGYTRVVDEDEPDMQHGQALHDVWALDLLSEQWRKVKRQGMAPGPRRGFRVVTQKRRAIMFGGSHDNETHGGEDISSEFFNDMYQFSLDSQRWFPLALKGSKQRGENAEGRRATNAGDDSVAAGHSGAVQHGAAGHGHLDDSRKDAKVIRAATRIQANYRGHRVRKAYKLFRIGGIVSEILYSPASYGTDMSVKNMPKPRARVNASLVVIKSTLWVFGGLVEIFDKEITLDDIWKLNLNKMDQWTCVKENTVGEEDFKDTHVSSDDDDEDD